MKEIKKEDIKILIDVLKRSGDFKIDAWFEEQLKMRGYKVI